MPPGDCLSDVTLGAYHGGALDAAALEAAAAHLRACPDCLARLERLPPSPDPVLAALRRPPPASPEPEESAYRAAVARLTGSAPAADARLGPGRQLREYRLLERLGQGGMGTVFKAL